MNLRTGAIYTFWYNNWHTNMKVYAFIFYAGNQSPYVHALNIGAVQLNTFDRVRIVMTIKKLSKISNSTFYNGRLLYTIFKKYLWPQVRKCYRTYNKQYVQRAALINYGLNKASEFSIDDMKDSDQMQFGIAQRDLIIKIMNLYTGGGTKLSDFRQTFATIPAVEAPDANNEANEQDMDETAVKDKPNII